MTMQAITEKKTLQREDEEEWLQVAGAMLERATRTDICSLAQGELYAFAEVLALLLKQGMELAQSSWRVRALGIPLLSFLATLCSALGRWDEANEYTKQAEQMATEYARNLDAAGSPKAAEFYEALKFLHRRQSPFVEARALLQSGQNLVEGGAWHAGLSQMHASLDLLRATDDLSGKAHTSLAIGEAHEKIGDYEVARGFFSDAERHFRRQGYSQGEAMARLHIGGIEVQLQRFEKARDYLESAQWMFEEQGDEERVELSRQWLDVLNQMECLPEVII